MTEYSLTKELIKNALTLKFIYLHLAESLDVIAWAKSFKLPVNIDENSLEAEASSIFIDAFLLKIDNLQLDSAFLNELADSLSYCFFNYPPKNIYEDGYTSVLSDQMPSDWDGQAYGYKNFYMLRGYGGDYYFSSSKKIIQELCIEQSEHERYILEDEDWQGYFPDQDLDEVFGFKREPKNEIPNSK